MTPETIVLLSALEHPLYCQSSCAGHCRGSGPGPRCAWAHGQGAAKIRWRRCRGFGPGPRCAHLKVIVLPPGSKRRCRDFARPSLRGA
jgi:hypothetical protein